MIAAIAKERKVLSFFMISFTSFWGMAENKSILSLTESISVT
jgi:mevalonate pyrophosphate decarboxylase